MPKLEPKTLLLSQELSPREFLPSQESSLREWSDSPESSLSRSLSQPDKESWSNHPLLESEKSSLLSSSSRRTKWSTETQSPDQPNTKIEISSKTYKSKETKSSTLTSSSHPSEESKSKSESDLLKTSEEPSQPSKDQFKYKTTHKSETTTSPLTSTSLRLMFSHFSKKSKFRSTTKTLPIKSLTESLLPETLFTRTDPEPKQSMSPETDTTNKE